MAVTATDLHTLNVTSPLRKFFYTSTGEAMATIIAANYFTAASLTGSGTTGMLRTNDLVYIKASDGDGTFKVGSNGTTAALIPVGWVNVFKSHTTSGALNTFGTNSIETTVGVNFTIPAPNETGQMFMIIQRLASTTFTFTSTGSVSGDTDTVLTMDALDDVATLMAVSTSKWIQIAVAGGTVGTTNTSSVFHPTS